MDIGHGKADGRGAGGGASSSARRRRSPTSAITPRASDGEALGSHRRHSRARPPARGGGRHRALYPRPPQGSRTPRPPPIRRCGHVWKQWPRRAESPHSMGGSPPSIRPPPARLHPNDRVRIIRALEISTAAERARKAAGRGPSPRGRCLLIGLCHERGALNRRLAERARGMFSGGMMDEVKRLLARRLRRDLPGMAGIGYRQVAAALEGTHHGGRGARPHGSRHPSLRQAADDVVRARARPAMARRGSRRAGPKGAAERIVKEMTREGWIA